MTTESLGTALIGLGVVLALLEIPLIIGAARVGASHKRLLEYAAQLRTRSGTPAFVQATFGGQGEIIGPAVIARPDPEEGNVLQADPQGQKRDDVAR